MGMILENKVLSKFKLSKKSNLILHSDIGTC